MMQTDPRFSGARVLVTGASGFIGSHLCGALVARGVEVHGVSRNERGSPHQEIRWWKLDLADLPSVRRLLFKVKPDLIFHLASHVEGARDLNRVIPTFQSNLAGTVNLLTVAAEAGCGRVLLTGSLEEPDESGDAIPCSPYAAAKWASSAYARMFSALYDLPAVILRLFMVYGPAQNDLRKLVPYVTLCLLRGETPKIGSGTRLVDWIYVEDVVQAMLAATAASSINGKTVDVGSGQLVLIREVVERLCQIVNPEIRPVFGALADRPLERVRKADVARSQELIDWHPATSLQHGLEKTVEWYRENRGVIEGESNLRATSNRDMRPR